MLRDTQRLMPLCHSSCQKSPTILRKRNICPCEFNLNLSRTLRIKIKRIDNALNFVIVIKVFPDNECSK